MSGAPYGGVERQVERLVGALEQHRFVQRVMLRQNRARAERLAAIGAVAVEMSFPSRFAFFARRKINLDQRKINNEIRCFGPDIVISWTPDVAAFVEKGSFVHLGRIGTTFDATALAMCDHLFTPSSSRANQAMIAQWQAKCVHVLPHVPMIKLEGVEAAVTKRKTFFTPPNAKLIVTASRLEKNAGLDVLFAALSRLPEYYLWVVGEGEGRKRLEKQAREAGIKPRIRFIGWHDELASIIAAGNVFVYPARHEDVGDAIVDAWGAGVPVVASDSLGPGLLIRHKKNGLLVPVGDAISMAEAIKWISRDSDLARRLGAAGRLTYIETFAADKIVPQYLDLFNTLASELAPKMGA